MIRPSTFSCWVTAATVAVPGAAFAVQYLTPEEAQHALFPAADQFRPLPSSEGLRGVSAEAHGAPLGLVLFDAVVGKTQLIDYAVGFSTDGTIAGVEILVYRESHGAEVRSVSWRQQFHGKSANSPLLIGDDIANISGATLSCNHLTQGIHKLSGIAQRLLAGHNAVVPK